MSQGLIPGTTLRMALSRREDAEALVTQVEDVTDDRLEVLVPMQRLRPRPLSTGTLVYAAYVFQRRRYNFISEVTGHSPDGSIEYLRSPGLIDSSERRSSFRLETSIKPLSLYRLVIDAEKIDGDTKPELDGVIVDLSEGGLCVSTAARITTGERLGVHASLGENGEFMARMSITGVDEPRLGQRNRRIHCRFTDITRGDVDKIARFLMKRQLEMRRRGQL
ncbi:MAG: PilZ domain-containing protein [Dehalococcoidia bacterium]|nr:PilZ domain-containing protein [Dehalococcoidia bacterium]